MMNGTMKTHLQDVCGKISDGDVQILLKELDDLIETYHKIEHERRLHMHNIDRNEELRNNARHVYHTYRDLWFKHRDTLLTTLPKDLFKWYSFDWTTPQHNPYTLPHNDT